jgi:tetratricopeptide (TPR) repeat protein
VKEVLIEGDMSSYVPKTEKEKENLAKGLVLYKGSWIKKDDYAKLLEKENERRRKEMETEAAHLQFADGWVIETPHFRFQGNCPKDILQDCAELLEEYYSVMNGKIGMKASPSVARKKMQVNVYRDEEDYFKSGASPGGSAGWFSQLDESLNFYYDYEDPSFTRHVMLHEGTHLLTYLANPKFGPPAWINEGMAEYFGSSKITGERGKRKMEPGQILDNRLQLLQEMEKSNYVPIDKWLAYSTTYGEVSRNGGIPYQHYAYWWGLCHFLAETPKYEKKFLGYFRDLYALNGFDKDVGYTWVGGISVGFSVSPEEYTRKLLERLGVKDVKKLDEEFRAWIKEQKPVGKRGYFIVGRDLLFEKKLDEALMNLDRAIAEGHNTSECYGYRARVWEGKKNEEKANADWRKAIELNPVEPSYRLSLASNLVKEKATRAEGVKQLEIAAELDPFNPFIQYLLGEAQKKL